MSEVQIEPGSFRDRSARVFYRDGVVLRKLRPQALQEWQAFSATGAYRRLASAGRLVETAALEPDAGDLQSGWAGVLRHERVPFVSYPYEWCFSMLKDAALLHLELLSEAVGDGFILKDATPYNVQWKGSQPVFIDLTSFQRLQPGEAWVGYKQFCELFLYPLMLQSYRGASFHPWLRGSLDGIDAKEARRLFSIRDFLRPGVISRVVLQAGLQSRYGDSRRDVRSELRQAGFSTEMIRANLKGLGKLVRRLEWAPGRSAWSDYAESNSYEAADRERKLEFVRSVLQSGSWSAIWDLGCNTGAFSRLAAEFCPCVVAFDADHLAVDRLYRRLRREEDRRVLPLVNNLASPSPAQGWRGLERKALDQRGKPDLILCLALIHHAVIGSNLPMEEFVAWLGGLQGDLVIEFVRREDPMAARLLRNKDDLYTDYDQQVFEACLARFFRLERKEVLGSGTRVLYFARNPARAQS